MLHRVRLGLTQTPRAGGRTWHLLHHISSPSSPSRRPASRRAHTFIVESLGAWLFNLIELLGQRANPTVMGIPSGTDAISLLRHLWLNPLVCDAQAPYLRFLLPTGTLPSTINLYFALILAAKHIWKPSQHPHKRGTKSQTA